MTTTTEWNHSGPDGVDGIEWWTRRYTPVGVTRVRGDRHYALADVKTGEPTEGNQYARYATLGEAQAVALRAAYE